MFDQRVGVAAELPEDLSEDGAVAEVEEGHALAGTTVVRVSHVQHVHLRQVLLGMEVF